MVKGLLEQVHALHSKMKTEPTKKIKLVKFVVKKEHVEHCETRVKTIVICTE